MGFSGCPGGGTEGAEEAWGTTPGPESRGHHLAQIPPDLTQGMWLPSPSPHLWVPGHAYPVLGTVSTDYSLGSP